MGVGVWLRVGVAVAVGVGVVTVSSGVSAAYHLHAIQRQPVHRSPSAQVTVPASTQQSTGIQTRCGTSLLYDPMPPTAVQQRRVVLGPTP